MIKKIIYLIIIIIILSNNANAAGGNPFTGYHNFTKQVNTVTLLNDSSIEVEELYFINDRPVSKIDFGETMDLINSYNPRYLLYCGNVGHEELITDYYIMKIDIFRWIMQ